MDPAAVAETLPGIVRTAVHRNGIGDFSGAAHILGEALTAADALPDELRAWWRARLLVTLAYSAFETSGEAAAMAHLGEARRLAEAIGSRRISALTYVQETNLLARGTSWDSAIRAGAAAAQFVDVLEPEEVFALHLNRGFAHMGVLHLDQSEQDLEAALSLAEAQGLDELRYKAVHNKGCLAYVRGDLPRALTLMREADELPVGVARDRNRLDQAQVLIDAGLVERAKGVLDDALVSAERAQHHIERAAIHLDLARCAILLGSAPDARDHAEDARRIFESLGARERSRRARLVSAQVALMDGEHLDEVEELLSAWTGVTTSDPDARTATRLRSELLLRRGAVEECLVLLRGLRPVAQGVEAQLHEDYLRAAVATATGDIRRSRSTCRRASVRFARRQTQSQSLDVRAALALHARRLATFDVEQSLANGRPSSIFASVERWRAASQRIPSVLPSDDARTAELISELRATQRTRSLTTQDNHATIDARTAQLSRLIERREWERQRRADRDGDTSPVSPSDALACAENSEATVHSFFAARGDLFALTLSERFACHRVAPLDDVLHAAAVLNSDLRARAVSHRIPALEAALDAAVDDSSVRLDELLFPPDGERGTPGAGNVVVVPARALASVPWNLLPTLRGRPVVVARSVTRWVRSSSAPRLPTTVGVAVGPGLTHALTEASRIRGVWSHRPGGPPPGGERFSTSSDVVDALGTSTLVHLAAHGTHEEANPMFSTLRMADGPLFLHELPRPCRAEHVVLAACDVGRSNVRHGDEALGVSAALLALGARSVVASVSPVDDELTGAAMVDYHEHLAAGVSAARALSRVTEAHPAASTFCVYGADWSAPAGPVR